MLEDIKKTLWVTADKLRATPDDAYYYGNAAPEDLAALRLP